LKVLFVCNQNKVRSLTAEHLYRVRPDLEVRSAGTATFAKTQLTAELLKWADQVFVFDDSQVEAINNRFADVPVRSEVVCLGLPDNFEYKSPRLIVKLTAKLEPYLGRPNAKPGRKSLPAKVVSRSQGAQGDPAVPPLKSLVSQLLTAVGVGSKKRPAAK
jgi:predicted protein tyrosine phosphatase